MKYGARLTYPVVDIGFYQMFTDCLFHVVLQPAMQIAIAVMQNLYKLLLLPCYSYTDCTEAGFATSATVQRPVHTRGYTDNRFTTQAVLRSASKSEHHWALPYSPYPIY